MGDSQQSVLFTPFRCLGVVSSPVPCSLQRRGTRHFVTTAVNNSFHIYDAAKLRLKFVGPQLPAPVTALASADDLTFVAAGEGQAATIYVCERAVEKFQLSGHTGAISQLLVFGAHLLSLSREDGSLKVWDVQGECLTSSLGFEAGFRPWVMQHPDTYLNKIVVGSEHGRVQLWNLRTQKRVYEYKALQGAGEEDSVTAVVQSPVVDVLAIGFQGGRVQVHDMKADALIVDFEADEPVTSLSFRSDGTNQLCCGCQSGQMIVFDLEERALASCFEPHRGAVLSAHHLVGEPAMLTVGADNAVHVWLFDSERSGEARQLRSRSGHAVPPSMVQYCGDDHRHMLSAAPDRTLRFVSTIQDHQNRELSQGQGLLKACKKLGVQPEALRLTPVISLATAGARSRDWPDVLTGHSGSGEARSWRFEHKALTAAKLSCKQQEPQLSGLAVAISACGNFGFTGWSNGCVDKFNMQSSKHRGQLLDPQLGKAHSAGVTAVCCDAMNELVITGSVDQSIKLWGFADSRLLHSMPLDSGVARAVLHRENELLAVATDSFQVLVFDPARRCIVRRFSPAEASITGLCFSPDARWLVAGSIDGSVRVLDLPSGACIDQFECEHAVTSLDFSPSGDFLASTHAAHTGVYLWANTDRLAPIELRQAAKAAQALPGALVEDEHPELLPPESTVRLSGVPRPHWANLAMLDQIKARNRAQEVAKDKEEAPFFLPTLPGLQPKFIAGAPAPEEPDWETGAWQDEEGDEDEEQEQEQQAGQKRKAEPRGPESALMRTLHADKLSGEYSATMAHLKGLGASALDVEVRMLSVEADLPAVLGFFCEQLKQGSNYELLQAELGHVLRVHGLEIAGSEELRAVAAGLLEQHMVQWEAVEDLMQYNLCLLGHLTRLQ